MYGDCILLFHKVPNQPASKMSAPCTTAADRPMFCEGSCVIIQLCNTQRIYTQFQRKYSNHSGGLDSSILPLVSLGTWCGKMKYGRLYIIQDFTWRFCSLDYTTDRLDIYLLSWGSFWKVHLEMNNKCSITINNEMNSSMQQISHQNLNERQEKQFTRSRQWTLLFWYLFPRHPLVCCRRN